MCLSSLPPCGAISEPSFHGSKSQGPERLTVAPNHIAWAVAESGFETRAHFLGFLTPWQRLCGTRRENPVAEEPGAEGSRHFTHPGSRPPSRCAAHAGGRQGPGRKRSPAATWTPWSARLARRGLSGRARALRQEPPAPPGPAPFAGCRSSTRPPALWPKQFPFPSPRFRISRMWLQYLHVTLVARFAGLDQDLPARPREALNK